MDIPGFIFGGNEPLTYEQLQRKRQIADALLAQNMRAPQTFGEGLTAVGRAIAAKKMNKKADARDAELRDDFNSRFAGAFSGGGGNFGATGAYGGGSYAAPPPKSQWDAGTTETPEQKAAREAASMGSWNGGAVSDMQPNMISTFGQEAPGGGKSGYNMGTDAAPSMALDVIKGFEGYRDTPYWDVNAYRTGYGSDTVTTADGKVIPVSQGMKITRDDAERDLQRRVTTEFMPLAASAVGPDAFAALSEPQQAALTSIAYNYGEIPGSVAAAVKSGDPQAAAAAIAALSSHNDGINAERRQQEAKMFLQGGAPGGFSGAGGGQQPFNTSMFGQIDEGQAPQAPMTGYGMGFTPQGTGSLTGGFDLATLANLAADPYASEGQKAIINALMTQQMNAMDPMYQMQLEQEQLKLAQMQGGGAVDPTKNAPNGYMWTDPRDPTKGVTLIPGYTPSGGQDININTAEGGLPGLGKLDPGYTYLYDEAGNVKRDADGMPIVKAIPGSKAEQEQKAAEAEAAAAEQQAALANDATTQTAGVVLGKLDQLDKIIDGAGVLNPATGFGAETAANIGGTNAANAKAVIDTIKANVGFETLAAMRAASPTGGALGAISDSEMTLLTSTLASLAQTQDPAQMKQHIAELRDIYGRIAKKAAAYPNASQFGFGGSQPTSAPVTTDDGYTIEVVE